MIAVCILAACAVIIYAAQPLTAWWDRRNAELDHLIADALQPTPDHDERERRWPA